ncbi:MAG: serine acetyltransferase [Parasporobacterium sp.]|nr:serine acetyltransferase [Parasporobacterium sp.]
MIKDKADLIRYIHEDMHFYCHYPRRERLVYVFTNDPVYQIAKYIRFMRKEEYFFNCRKDKIGKLVALWYLRRKNTLGNKLGFKIPRNTIEEGLTIFHNGEIIVNETVKVGKNAVLHGGNCIGNDGSSGSGVPVIGDNLDLGIGAKVIGDVRLGNNVKIGANAVVTRSFEENNITLVGLPARKV